MGITNGTCVSEQRLPSLHAARSTRWHQHGLGTSSQAAYQKQDGRRYGWQCSAEILRCCTLYVEGLCRVGFIFRRRSRERETCLHRCPYDLASVHGAGPVPRHPWTRGGQL